MVHSRRPNARSTSSLAVAPSNQKQ
jgi:hypothetical protein